MKYKNRICFSLNNSVFYSSCLSVTLKLEISFFKLDHMVKTTFIIDDDETYVYAMKRLISIKNHSEEVLSFKNGKEAIDYFIETPEGGVIMPDVVLLDVRMPVMDGWGFLDAFSQLDIVGKDEVNLYMVSSSIDPQDLEKANSAPFVKKYLFKPINSDDLRLIYSHE